MLRRHPIIRYYAWKILVYFVTIWGAFTIAFFLFRLVPTNPIDSWVRSLERQYSVTIEGGADLAKYYKEQFGLEGSLWEQYTRYMYNLIVKQDFGPSFVNFPTPVQDLLLQRIPWTLGLMSVSVLLAWILGILIGGVAGWFRDSPLSDALTNLAIALSQIPPYLIAIFMVLFLGYQWKLFPTRGAWDAQYAIGFNWDFIKSVLWHSFLPALSIIIVSLAGWILSTRSLIVTLLGEDFLMYAEAKGLPSSQIMTRYALRNALLPQAMGLALTMGFIMSGQLLIELQFVYPGLGELMSRAIQVFDYNTMMGIISLSIFSVMTASLLVELALPIIDPRIRREIMA